jgi:hypothetical protein
MIIDLACPAHRQGKDVGPASAINGVGLYVALRIVARSRGSICRNAVCSSSTSQPQKPRLRKRSRKRQLCCFVSPQQQLAGGGKRYFLHLLTAEELTDRGMLSKTARRVISAYPVILSDEWLEELFCPECGMSRWCHVVRHNRVEHTVH